MIIWKITGWVLKISLLALVGTLLVLFAYLCITEQVETSEPKCEEKKVVDIVPAHLRGYMVTYEDGTKKPTRWFYQIGTYVCVRGGR